VAKILFVTLPFPGCLHPHLAVARALAARQHEVCIYTGASARSRVEQEGFFWFPFAPALDAEFKELVLGDDAIGLHWRRPWQLQARMCRFFIETIPLQLRDLDVLLAEWEPDVIACDPSIWAPFLVVSETRRVPVALLSYIPWCTLPGPDAPPMGLGLPRPIDWRTRTTARFARTVLNLFGGRIRRLASQVRESRGLPPLPGSVVDLTGQLPLFLIPSCPEFDYGRHDLPSSVHYVGPLTWYPPDASSSFLDDLPRDRPWVHATEGTIHVQEPLVLRAAASGLADAPLHVILTTGGNRDSANLALGPLAKNVTVVNWVNHNDLFPRIDLLICTGGAGAVLAALQAGVPVVGVPTEWDHLDTVQRLVETGVGVRLSPRRCTPGRLREAVDHVLRHSSYRDNARRLSRSLSQLGGAGRAAALIETLIA
jgi:MGT family glycosyltransferase